MTYDVKENKNGSEIVENNTEVLEKVEINEASKKKSDAIVVDFGDFTGTATIEGTLDIRKFIDVAMDLPTIKKKFGGRKPKPPTL